MANRVHQNSNLKLSCYLLNNKQPMLYQLTCPLPAFRIQNQQKTPDRGLIIIAPGFKPGVCVNPAKKRCKQQTNHKKQAIHAPQKETGRNLQDKLVTQ
jgi:hypothetical protein